MCIYDLTLIIQLWFDVIDGYCLLQYRLKAGKTKVRSSRALNLSESCLLFLSISFIIGVGYRFLCIVS